MGKTKVLVIDSSLFIRTVLKSQMQSMGYDVTVVPTAKIYDETTVECRDMQPNIVLVDLAIAEKDNFALIRAARECSHQCCVIVMIPDGPGFLDIVVDAVKAGATGYIVKPVSPNDLKSRVEAVLKRQRRI